MKLCLASVSSRKYLSEEYVHCKYMLESFWSMENWLIPIVKGCELFLLDSGAFTFMTSQTGGVDFDEYLGKYIDFINENDIRYFFELDVDSVVGLREVERMRDRLEDRTGKKCIPVFHRSRGKQYFIDMCKGYDYVAVGGIVSKEIKPNEYKYFRWFIDTAHEYGCQIHGLGFTNLDGLYQYNFDSVDSTSWCSGGRFGALYHFDGKYLKQLDTKDRRRKSDIGTDPINRANYYEWLKFQEYADRYL